MLLSMCLWQLEGGIAYNVTEANCARIHTSGNATLVMMIMLSTTTAVTMVVLCSFFLSVYLVIYDCCFSLKKNYNVLEFQEMDCCPITNHDDPSRNKILSKYDLKAKTKRRRNGTPSKAEFFLL